MVFPFFALLLLLNLVPTNQTFKSLNDINALEEISCPCESKYAGSDKVICATSPGGTPQSVMIGCDEAVSDPSCAHLCYTWQPANGLNPNDYGKPNPVVSPTVTTTYTVHVVSLTGNTGGNNLGDYQVTVFVVTGSMTIYKPRVITGNTTTPATPADGAQTFENLDNDDTDQIFDNADNKILNADGSGDDELVKLELKLQPVDLADRRVKVFASSGAADVKFWNSESKLSEYIPNTDIILAPDPSGTYLTYTLWVEGRNAQTVQRGTKIEMLYQDVNPCDADAYLTIIGVESVTWEGINNSISNNNVLDSDPNLSLTSIPPTLPPFWPSGSVRVFPDARPPNYLIANNQVTLNVVLTVTPIEPVNLFIKSFDIDDPTNESLTDQEFIDPNDFSNAIVDLFYPGTTDAFYNLQEDNRGPNPKSGTLAGQNVYKIATLAFINNAQSILLSGLSMHPGDNYRCVVNGDVDFVKQLENLDYRDKYAIVDPNIAASTFDPHPGEIQKPMNYASPILTVWRFLQVENASMRNVNEPIDNSQINTFTDFQSPINDTRRIEALTASLEDLRIYDALVPLIDPSPWTSLAPIGICSGNGRFENGDASVFQDPALHHQQMISNDINQINFSPMNPLDLTNVECRLRDAAGATIIAHLNQVTKVGGDFDWDLNLPPGTNLALFVGGQIKFTNTANQLYVNIVGVVNPNTVRTNDFILKMYLLDDDASSGAGILPQHLPLDVTAKTYRRAYLETVDIGGTQNIPFDAYLDDVQPADIQNINMNFMSGGNENDNYWVVFIIACWQYQPWSDWDPHIITMSPPCPAVATEGPIYLGYTSPTDYPNITDMVSNQTIVNGMNHSYIFVETLRESPVPQREETAIPHEIGHQFGLGHGSGYATMPPILPIPECCGPATMGLMTGGDLLVDQAFLIPRYQNLIRSRIHSPGH